MRIAIQEDMLPGRTILEKFERAKSLGVQGIEFWGRDLAAKVEDIIDAIERTGVRAATVNHGRQGRILDADPLERERGLEQLRSSITCAADIDAEGVIFVPHFFSPSMPDLSPYMSAVELEAEMLHMHLRTLSDYADAMSINLYVEPINRYETHFLNRLEQAARVATRINHPRVKIVADLFHMALEETNSVTAIKTHADVIGHVHLADSNRRLPGQGLTQFAQIAAALKEINYAGWAAFECGNPGDNAAASQTYLSDFPASLELLKQGGWM